MSIVCVLMLIGCMFISVNYNLPADTLVKKIMLCYWVLALSITATVLIARFVSNHAAP